MQVYSEDWCRILSEWSFSIVLWHRNDSVDFVPWCFNCRYDFWFCKIIVLVSHPACFSSCCLEFHYDDHAGYICIRFTPVIAVSCCSSYQQCKRMKKQHAGNKSFSDKNKNVLSLQLWNTAECSTIISVNHCSCEWLLWYENIWLFIDLNFESLNKILMDKLSYG